MITIKQSLFVFILFALAGNVFSQESKKVRGDSIRIKFDNCLLEVSTFDLKDNTLEKAEVQKKLNELLKELDKVEINIPDEGEKIWIKYTDFTGGMEQEIKRLELSSLENNSKSMVVH